MNRRRTAMAIGEDLAGLTAHLKRNAPATEEQWRAFVAQIGFEPPADYRDFMMLGDGGYGEGELLVFLHPLAEAARRGRELELPDGLVAFGSDGGGVNYAFDGRNPKKVQVVEVDDSGEDKVVKLGATLTAALKKLRARREKAERDAEKMSKLPPTVPPAGPGMPGEVGRILLADWDCGITGISFADDSATVAITSGRGLEVWTAAGGRRLMGRGEAGEGFSGYGALFYDRPRNRIVTWHGEGVATWDATTGERVSAMKFDAPYWGAARFIMPGGERALVMPSGAGLQMWDVATGARVYTVTERGYYYLATARADGALIAVTTRGATGHGNFVHVLDPATGSRLAEVEFPEMWAPTPAFLPDGRVLAAGHVEAARVFEPTTGEVIRQFRLGLGQDGETIKTLAAAPVSPPRIVAGTSDWVALFDATDGRLIHRFETIAPGAAPTEVAISPDGKWLATAGRHDLGIKDRAVVRVWALG